MHLAATEGDRHDILGIGNAIVDILAYAEEELIEDLGLARGAMSLIDEERSGYLYRRLGPAREVSGGSCANTIAAVASLGGRGAFIGRVRDDQLGQVFSHDIRAAGVTFRNPPSPTGPATATSMIFVTPDGQHALSLAPTWRDTVTTFESLTLPGPPDEDEPPADQPLAASAAVYFAAHPGGCLVD